MEDCKSLVDERQNVHTRRLLLLLHLDGGLELFDGLLVLALVQEEFTVVVVYVGNLLEVLHAPPECGHTGSDRAHLVLSHAELNVGEDELRV